VCAHKTRECPRTQSALVSLGRTSREKPRSEIARRDDIVDSMRYGNDSMALLRTDRVLLDGFRAGAPDALGRVYAEYVRKVERLLSAGFEVRGRGTRVGGACRQPQDLADLVQDVFLRAFSPQGRQAYDGLRDYGPYLFAIARNVLVDWARVLGREIPSPWIELEAAIEIVPVIDDTAP